MGAPMPRIDFWEETDAAKAWLQEHRDEMPSTPWPTASPTDLSETEEFLDVETVGGIQRAVPEPGRKDMGASPRLIVCNDCHVPKVADDFYATTINSNGTGVCKRCKVERTRHNRDRKRQAEYAREHRRRKRREVEETPAEARTLIEWCRHHMAEQEFERALTEVADGWQPEDVARAGNSPA